MPTRLFLLVLMVLFIFPGSLHAAGLFQPGFRTFGYWTEDPPMRMDMNIWYPTRRTSQALSYPPWTVNGAANARATEGRFPLILVSHATPASRFSHHDLGSFLAQNGYIVVAPTHARDNINNMDDLFTWNQLANRVHELSECVKILLNDADLGPRIERKAIGAVGFEAGGAAVLLMAGAIPDCSSWKGYCQRAKKNDSYCMIRAKEKISRLCENFPLKESLANPDIRAVAAISPAYGMIFGNDSFDQLKVPALLVGAGKERFNSVAMHCEPLAKLLGKKAEYIFLPEVDASGLTSPCPPALEQELPELCGSVSRDVRQKALNTLHNHLLAFFARVLAPPVIVTTDSRQGGI